MSGAVAGDGLAGAAGHAADALGCPVGIALPSLVDPVVRPLSASDPETVRELIEHADAVMRGLEARVSKGIADSVAVRIGPEVVGVVVAFGPHRSDPDRRAWLEATAAAASVAALMGESDRRTLDDSRRTLLRALAAGPPVDLDRLLGDARRLGYELDRGAIAICAQRPPGSQREVPMHGSALLAEMGRGRVWGLIPSPASTPEGDAAAALAAELEADGLQVALSAPRRSPGDLHEAMREAELLIELTAMDDSALPGQEETYRLLIGVGIRNPDELEQLRARTIAPLQAYDTQHDTDLLATLQAFLAHHGSTTDTAEAMKLHRHTVGYRLSRVQNVCGLSPYESDGRERLSLGLKAHEILRAKERCTEPL